MLLKQKKALEEELEDMDSKEKDSIEALGKNRTEYESEEANFD